MCRGNKIILLKVFSIQKITDMLSSNHHLSLYTKLMTVPNKDTGKAFVFVYIAYNSTYKEDWQSTK